MYCLLLFNLKLSIHHLYQKGNVGTLLPAPPFHLVNINLKHLAHYKFVELYSIAVPYIALSCEVLNKNSPSSTAVEYIPISVVDRRPYKSVSLHTTTADRCFTVPYYPQWLL